MNNKEKFSYSNLMIGNEVAKALQDGLPVVAMETGYLAHREEGRDHVKDALECVECIRKNGAVPAVVAIFGGKLRVGLEQEELKAFLQRDDLVKCNMRDLCVAIYNRSYGTTTISATVHAAALAGISIVAAGGIGGVHRGVQKSYDISPDLDSIAGYPGIVICSGAKSILDIPLTIEYLETKGVTVVGYNTNEFPAYYVRESDLPLEHICHTPKEAAALLKSKQTIGDTSGMIIANPIRKEAAQDKQAVEDAIANALQKAEKQKIQGKGITLFLLNEVEKQIGKSIVDSSFYIKRDNAELAAKIAVALYELQ